MKLKHIVSKLNTYYLNYLIQISHMTIMHDHMCDEINIIAVTYNFENTLHIIYEI